MILYGDNADVVEDSTASIFRSEVEPKYGSSNFL
jgi:hypothetical protein